MENGEAVCSGPTQLGSLLYFPNDIRIGRSLQYYGEWGGSELEVLDQIIRPGDTVVDAGAYIGTHTVAFAKLAGERGAVHAFEPLREAVELLSRNSIAHGLSNIIVYHQALGRAAGSVKVPALDLSKPGDYSAYSAAPAADGTRVERVTLDSLNLPSCRLLKIDVDGEESQILDGAQSFIARLRPVIFVEANRKEEAAAIIRQLTVMDYKLYWHLDFLFRRGNFNSRSEDIFNGSFDVNLLALPSEMKASVTKFEPVTGPDDCWQDALKRSKLASP